MGLTAEQLAADLVRVGLEEEAIHAAAVTGPLVVGEVVELTPEPQKNGKTINWCRVDVGAEHNEPVWRPARHRVRRAQLRRRRPCRRRPARGRPARTVRDRVAQDVRARVRRHDLLGARAGPGRGPRRDHRAVRPRAGRARRHGRARAPRPRRGGPRDQRDARPRVLLLDARGRSRVQPVDRRGVHRPRTAVGSTSVRRAAASRSRSTTRRRSTASRAPTASSRRSFAACARTTRRPPGCSAGSSRPACGRSAWPSTSPTT